MSPVLSGTRIAALGHHQPEHVLTNDDLARLVETNDTWIRRRTGIAERRIARDESVADLATRAAGKALATAGVDPADIGMVVVATCSARDRCPSTAAEVAGRLGLAAPVAYDLNNGCAGFCTALASAGHSLAAGAVRHALVIGAEKMSDVTDWTDRSTCVLLADGAGAAVISATDDPGDAGLGPVVWGSDASRRDLVRLQGAWQPHFEQEGQAVFRWVTSELPKLARLACERAGLTPDGLAGVVTHQANLRMIEALVRELELPERVVVGQDVVGSGNTSAASVPLALSKLVEEGRFAPGDPVLLLSFGGGLSWAGQVVRCP